MGEPPGGQLEQLAWEHPVIVNFIWQLGLEATLMVIIGNLVQEYRLVASLGN